MKIQPRKWTQHHTQRVLHLPILAMSLFLLATIIYAFFIFFMHVRADLSGSVSLSATVVGIQPGPEVILASNSASAPAAGSNNSSAQKTINPNVNSNPGPVDQQTKLDNSPKFFLDSSDSSTGASASSGRVYSSQLPAFSGKTDIKNAIIFIEIHSVIIRATTYADSDGKWSWTPTDPLEIGKHTLMITAQDPLAPEIIARATYNFVVKLLPGQKPLPTKQYPALKKTDQTGTLFDVLVRINPEFKIVAPGDEVLATIKLINFGEAGSPVDVPVEYTIKNSKGEVISDTSETIAVATQISLLKTFTLTTNLPEDTYILSVHVPSKDVIASASDTFKVQGQQVIAFAGGKVNYTIIFQALLALFFLFSLITYFEYSHVVMLSRYIKQVEEKDLSKES